MENISKSQIIGALPKLSKEERAEVYAVLLNLIGVQPPNLSRGNIGNQKAIFDALSTVLGNAIPFASLPAKIQDNFNKKVSMVEDFFNRYLKGWDNNRIVQKSFLLEMMQLLKEDLKRLDLQPSFTIMINNFHRMSEVFRNAFPGYIETGMVQLIFDFEKPQRRTRGKGND